MRLEREGVQQQTVAKANNFSAAAQKILATLNHELPGNATLVEELGGWLKNQTKKYGKVLQASADK